MCFIKIPSHKCYSDNYTKPAIMKICQKLILFFVSALILFGGRAAALSLQHGSGTVDDPAPGRSPGPPTTKPILSTVTSQTFSPTTITGTTTSEKNSWFCENSSSIEGSQLNFTINHPIYNTSFGLLPGVTYKVEVSLISVESNNTYEFVILSTIDDNEEVSQWSRGPCPGSTWGIRGQISPLQTIYSYNWIVESTGHQFNITFKLLYRSISDTKQPIYQVKALYTVLKECRMMLLPVYGNVTWRDLPRHLEDCYLTFPESGGGLLVELTRLNIPCKDGGYLQFSEQSARLCGKLEELSLSSRRLHFSSPLRITLHVHKSPIFAIKYRLVHHCFNVTLTFRNDTLQLSSKPGLQCTFHIHLPYGNQVSLRLRIGKNEEGDDKDSTNYLPSNTEYLNSPPRISIFNGQDFSDSQIADFSSKCDGLLTQLWDSSSYWSWCTKKSDSARDITIDARGNTATLKVIAPEYSIPVVPVTLQYEAKPISEIVQQCPYGWVSMRQFCITAVEELRLPWNLAELECTKRGGHLASITTEHAQSVVDNVLLNSPGFKDDSSYWIGASDKTHEGDFKWTNGQLFSYNNWFPGWPQERYYNRQPNDDGYSDQDCVEVRREYRLQTSGTTKLTNSFMWNDRDCDTPNMFICEILRPGAEPVQSWGPECNRSVTLSRDLPRGTVTSPGFPRQYPDNSECVTDVAAPPGYRLVLDFEELVLEEEPYCSYDFVEILEEFPPDGNNRKLCGDWSSKLKLLRYVSKGAHLRLRFVSDYSHHYSGFKARISMENAVMECADDRLQMFNNSCYLFVSYPEVTWLTAFQICRGMKAELASIQNSEEEVFITTNIRDSPEYSTSAIYWLGGKLEDNRWHWTDGSEMTFTGWENHEITTEIYENVVSSDYCLGIQWMMSSNTEKSSGLYWKRERCSFIGGYVCKRGNQVSGNTLNLNKTINGTDGYLSSPNFPGSYYNNLDYWVHIIGPERARLVLRFNKLDLEYQDDCLYDYVELHSGRGDRYVKWCSSRHSDIERFYFVSDNNEMLLRFHSDYSVSGSGFYAIWRAVDTSGCPIQTLTAREGILESPNFPYFLLSHLDCSTTILAPARRRIWIEFTHFDLGGFTTRTTESDAVLLVDVGVGSSIIKPFQTFEHLTDGAFLSTGSRIQILLRTGTNPTGIGFRATYKTVNIVREERAVLLTNTTMGYILHLNYPEAPPPHVDYTQRLVAPLGYSILLELYHVSVRSGSTCPGSSGVIEVKDSYADQNGTQWYLCEDSTISSPVSITSYLNSLIVIQRSEKTGVHLNGTVKVHLDISNKLKLLKASDDDIGVESCLPNPCENSGKCVSSGFKKFCQCTGYYTGMFCALTFCDFDPCVFGECQLTSNSYICQCQKGYTGNNCELKLRPCAENPCEGRGECVEKGDSFQCKCHAWWEGPRCERKMMHIPYKPLSERMLHEPFWLGLITVMVVLGIIGLFWCAKRHFPEKLEKILAEEAERSRALHSSHPRTPSVREQIAAASAAMVVVPSPQSTGPRSFFGRLGIRKPSLLSLTSSHGHSNATAARTFSLDDLLKAPPRRTPSPRKKRTNSTPTKKNIAEKKQILQQLITPSASQQPSRNVSLGELIQLNERKMSVKSSDEITETTFTNVPTSEQSSCISPIDAKLEKKVTFARLLSKVSAEMSSGSELELTSLSSKPPQLSRANSSPPSPAAGMRSPHSTSSNQGSDSISSLDVTGTVTGIPGLAELLGSRRPNRLTHSGKPVKNPSADSILAMFRNFSSNAAANSHKISPSTTPTASSPQDDVAGSDESSTSSAPTPLSSSSYTLDSPPAYHRNTIEIPVLDVLAGGNSGNLLHPPTILLEVPSSSMGKCLSPIRELPTPLPTPAPSPALTPIMPRSNPFPRNRDIPSIVQDRKEFQLPSITITNSDDDESSITKSSNEESNETGQDENTERRKSPITLPPLLLKTENESGSDTRDSSGEFSAGETGCLYNAPRKSSVIPILTIQTPSPTKSSPPLLQLPGSPPPLRRASVESAESPFSHPLKMQRKLLKEMDKPNSLDLACPPPMITVTCNMSELESDTDSVSPANKAENAHNTGNSASTGMCYLSPFSMCSRADRTASESNLSSSGYSSMASPGPSRCGSNNPLCPSEVEDGSASPSPTPGSGNTTLQCQTLSQRKVIPLLRTPATLTGTTEAPRDNQNPLNNETIRGRCSDSETLSDDLFVESNDEGISTDHLDEKIEDGELKSAKELEMFIGKELLENGKVILGIPSIGSNTCTKSIKKCGSLDGGLDSCKLLPPPPAISKSSLQLPSIVIQPDVGVGEKYLSPVSSRSESPLSDKVMGPGRFSPLFYGRHKDQLPFTDSDGLYDCPSSDCPRLTSSAPSQQHRKSTGRRRERRSSTRSVSGTRSKTPSPTRGSLLDVPGKEVISHHRPSLARKPSPKRSRMRTQQPVSSSSSSESLPSGRDLSIRLSSDKISVSNTEKITWSSSQESKHNDDEWRENTNQLVDISTDDPYEDLSSHSFSRTPRKEEMLIPHRKINRLRAIGHQIRFLRRLELSLKKRERLVSPSDSYGDDDDDDDEDNGSESPPALSPLLQKSHSNGHLQQRSRGRLRSRRAQGGEMLLPQEDTWRNVKVTAGSGHTD